MRLLCLPGDGIGPEIMAATCQVLRAACPGVTLEEADIGFAALQADGTTIPDAVRARAREVDGVVLGPVSHNAYPPVAEGGLNPSGVLRKDLALFANIRPARSHQAVPTPTGHKVDMVVVRENLEGFYADRNMHEGPGEFMPVPGVALSVRRITEANSRAIAETAYRLAAQRRGKVAVIHKANVLRLSDGLFLDTVRDVARAFPQVETEELLIDAAAAHFVRDPSRFDVVLATNMYGDILSDLASELAGGLGLAASLNHGAEHAVAQAQHGSAPDIAGQDAANPASLIGSAAMLLEHLGQPDAARRITTALDAALARPDTRTRDLGGALGTRAFADHLTQRIEATP
ncbi:isocitrate/isopropylmalate dehydrogenase family protein [Aestuariicoccus sp. MJ-SS9]|uniref:isocitrate/isopropylmalate dehydrogenase family protein n=1 Tax=Aestuariicoccus sp. MJ-SS9 TaxID=3079855 RepID=UPI00290BACB9|nr:isocitrate/isopropylmalate dehydrogenase family protein [Aestuariicoccus sp. MJ-SS9]MDU8909767.1 isocitrate/isopropylmalate dehydrogenase family protein [Aestuariicoccus sp. MJ-SS9]